MHAEINSAGLAFQHFCDIRPMKKVLWIVLALVAIVFGFLISQGLYRTVEVEQGEQVDSSWSAWTTSDLTWKSVRRLQRSKPNSPTANSRASTTTTPSSFLKIPCAPLLE